MREAFLQRLQRTLDSLRQQLLCLWDDAFLPIIRRGAGGVNVAVIGHGDSSFLSLAGKTRTREIALPGRARLLEGQAVIFFGLLFPLLFFEERLNGFRRSAVIGEVLVQLVASPLGL